MPSWIDTFTDTNATAITAHTPDSGGAYTSAISGNATGGLAITSNNRVKVSAANGHALGPVSTPSGTFTMTGIFVVGASPSNNANNGFTCYDSGETSFYQFRLNNSSGLFLQLIRTAPGSAGLLGSTTFGAGTAGNTVEFDATITPGAGKIDFSVVVKVNGSSIGTFTATDNSPLTLAGSFLGLRGDGPVDTDANAIALDSVNYTAPGPSISPTTAASGANTTYTLTNSGTNWTSGTLATISGLTGSSIVSQSITGQVITLTVNPGRAAGTLTVGNSTDSNTVTVAITLGLPAAPTSPTCTPGNAQNVLGWTAPTTGGTPATYSVFRGTTPGGESGTALATGLATTAYTDSTAANGTAYYYTIKSVNATGSSSASSEVSGTPTSGPALSLSPTGPVTLAPGTVLSITATRTGGTGALAATTTGGTLSTASPTSGTPFTWTAPGTTGTYTVTIADSADSLTQSITITVASIVQYDSIVSGLTTGLAGSATVTPKAWNGTAYATPGGCTVGTVVESDQPGTYIARIGYPASAIPSGTVPQVAWLVGGSAVIDPLPYPVLGTTGVTLAQLNAALAAGVVVTTNNDKVGYSLSPTQLLAAPRDLSTVPDNAMTINDAHWSAIGAGTGKQAEATPTSYVVKTPAGTVLRTFVVTLDVNGNPIARN